jgi:hypothetical protein
MPRVGNGIEAEGKSFHLSTPDVNGEIELLLDWYLGYLDEFG